MKNIHATVGILTFNSEENLSRCLESVKDFTEIIVADGGSTDATLEIARAAGARVIQQSNPGFPIVDFSLERNRLLESATEPWFFYLDSDEIMSPELIEFIKEISQDTSDLHGAYRVRYVKTNADASKVYCTYKEYYQIRLVRTDVGAHFERPVHERIVVPQNILVGQTESSWYVPLDAQDLSFRIFAKKAWKRIGIQASGWRPSGIFDSLQHIVINPVILICKSLIKMFIVKIRYGDNAIPAKYEMLRIFYSLMISLQHIRRLFVGRTIKFVI